MIRDVTCGVWECFSTQCSLGIIIVVIIFIIVIVFIAHYMTMLQA